MREGSVVSVSFIPVVWSILVEWSLFMMSVECSLMMWGIMVSIEKSCVMWSFKVMWSFVVISVESFVMWSIMMLVMKCTKAVKWVVVGGVIAFVVWSIVNWVTVRCPVSSIMGTIAVIKAMSVAVVKTESVVHAVANSMVKTVTVTMVTVVDSVTVAIGMVEIMAKTVTITVFAIASSFLDIDINVNICSSSIVMVRCPCMWVFAIVSTRFWRPSIGIFSIVWSEACWNSVRHLLSEEDLREGETEGVSEFVVVLVFPLGKGIHELVVDVLAINDQVMVNVEDEVPWIGEGVAHGLELVKISSNSGFTLLKLSSNVLDDVAEVFDCVKDAVKSSMSELVDNSTDSLPDVLGVTKALDSMGNFSLNTAS